MTRMCHVCEVLNDWMSEERVAGLELSLQLSTQGLFSGYSNNCRKGLKGQVGERQGKMDCSWIYHVRETIQDPLNWHVLDNCHLRMTATSWYFAHELQQPIEYSRTKRSWVKCLFCSFPSIPLPLIKETKFLMRVERGAEVDCNFGCHIHYWKYSRLFFQMEEHLHVYKEACRRWEPFLDMKLACISHHTSHTHGSKIALYSI